jgi:hypothetical protein
MVLKARIRWERNVMTHADRRHLGTPITVTRLTGDALVQAGPDDAAPIEIRLTDIRQVRLAVEMAGQGGQVVCYVQSQDQRQLVFGSMAFKSAGVWENNIETFQPLLEDLHRALEPHDANIRYVEGQSLAFRAMLFAFGIILTALSLPGFLYLFFGMQNRAALFMLPAPILGIWLVRHFRPKAPEAYDPGRYRSPSDL